MSFKGEGRDNKVYAIIAIFIIVVIILGFFFSSNQIIKAYIEDDNLGENWSEDLNERTSGSSSFGLEKWSSFTYRNNNLSYPAYISVSTFKTLFMMSEEDLLKETITTIINALRDGLQIDEDTKIQGERTIKNGHETKYIIFDGNDTSKEPIEKIKIIGETWSCDDSGTSIICIGFAQITDNLHNSTITNFNYWQNITSKDGLIYNIKCH